MTVQRAALPWRHVIINTRGSWLPGDPRGFRSRHHKVHSSGDYRHRPPDGEHRGLFEYSQKMCPDATTIPTAARGDAGWAVCRELEKQQLQPLALCVGGHHTHMLVRLPDPDAAQWDVVGDCKRVASHAVRDRLPGSIWARRGRIVCISNKVHHRRVYRYKLDHVDQRAWVWSFRNGVVFDPTG